ncbi:MAG: heme exporter protein CcmB [Chloroflexi bacterium]|nr:heme exporter protein CcmB [Chloroflexota bacterium]
MSVLLQTEPNNNALVAPPSLENQPVQMHTGGGVGAYLRKVGAIADKDLRAEIRAKEVFSTMTVFSVLAVVIFGMAFDLRVAFPTSVVPGVLWAVMLFTGVLGLNRSFGAEVDRGSLAALLLAPVDRSAIYFGKLLANLFFLLATQCITLPAILVIFNVNIFQTWILVSLLLGTVGYVTVGTLFAALSASVRARESMLPILLLPVMLPVFMAGTKITGLVLDGKGLNDIQRWLGILIAYDLIFLVVAFLVFDLIWEEL